MIDNLNQEFPREMESGAFKRQKSIFRNEISDLSPDFSDVTYEGLITLVGIANIDNVVTYIAGADGNYIG